MIVDAVQVVWTLPLGERLGVGLVVLSVGSVGWLATVMGLRRGAVDAPWWAVDLAGVVIGMACGFGVVLAAAASLAR